MGFCQREVTNRVVSNLGAAGLRFDGRCITLGMGSRATGVVHSGAVCGTEGTGAQLASGGMDGLGPWGMFCCAADIGSLHELLVWTCVRNGSKPFPPT